MAEKRRGLGRGLGALIPNSTGAASGAAKEAAPTQESEKKPTKTAAARVAQTAVVSPPARPKKTGKTAASSAPQRIGQQKEKGKKATGSIPQDLIAELPKTPRRIAPKITNTPAKIGPIGRIPKDVSRETSKKRQRVDMASALRNTTMTRRPVDFFFGEEDATGNKPADTNEELIPVPDAQFVVLNVSDIHPNRKQPRRDFDEQDMEELIHSVREIGVLQPIVVRHSREKGAEKYELVMGERRWRATQRAGLETIPAIIRNTQDNNLLRDALLENLHRSQLNPIEEAAAYQQLMDEFGTTQEQLAQRIGRSRPQISNTIRLLKLPALVQRRVAAGVISAGHARVLLTLTDQAQIETLAQKIVNEGLSVRATEEMVSIALIESQKKPRKDPQPQNHRERLDRIADSFADRLDTSVKISLGARKGKMTIEFANVDDLNRIVQALETKADGN